MPAGCPDVAVVDGGRVKVFEGEIGGSESRETGILIPAAAVDNQKVEVEQRARCL